MTVKALHSIRMCLTVQVVWHLKHCGCVSCFSMKAWVSFVSPMCIRDITTCSLFDALKVGLLVFLPLGWGRILCCKWCKIVPPLSIWKSCSILTWFSYHLVEAGFYAANDVKSFHPFLFEKVLHVLQQRIYSKKCNLLQIEVKRLMPETEPRYLTSR